MSTIRKVLVIDDDEDFGLALTYFFENRPFSLLLAHTLAAGMGILEREQPGYIFLDNGLPDGFGWEKAAYIMANYPRSRLILISALRMPTPLVKVHRILRKPISLHDMMACLE